MNAEELFWLRIRREGKEESRAVESWRYGDPAKHVKFESEKRGGGMDGQELHAHCEAWRQWCATRQYFIAPGTKNLLARMQPAKVGAPPDAMLSDEMSFFNMAVHALADMGDPDTACFVEYYWFRKKNIKSVAYDMGISRVTFYERKSRFAKRAYSMAQSLKRAHLAAIAMPAGPSEEID